MALRSGQLVSFLGAGREKAYHLRPTESAACLRAGIIIYTIFAGIHARQLFSLTALRCPGIDEPGIPLGEITLTTACSVDGVVAPALYRGEIESPSRPVRRHHAAATAYRYLPLFAIVDDWLKYCTFPISGGQLDECILFLCYHGTKRAAVCTRIKTRSRYVDGIKPSKCCHPPIKCFITGRSHLVLTPVITCTRPTNQRES